MKYLDPKQLPEPGLSGGIWKSKAELLDEFPDRHERPTPEACKCFVEVKRNEDGSYPPLPKVICRCDGLNTMET